MLKHEAELLAKEKTARAKQDADRLRQEELEKVRAEAAKLKHEAELLAKEKTARAKQDADRLRAEEVAKAKQEAARLKADAERQAREKAREDAARNKRVAAAVPVRQVVAPRVFEKSIQGIDRSVYVRKEIVFDPVTKEMRLVEIKS
jgi:hypothetical protein